MWAGGGGERTRLGRIRFFLDLPNGDKEEVQTFKPDECAGGTYTTQLVPEGGPRRQCKDTRARRDPGAGKGEALIPFH